MSIEAILERIAVSLERLASAPVTGLPPVTAGNPAAVKPDGKKPAAGKPAPEAPATEPKALTYADAAGVVQTFVKKKGKPAALEVLAPFGIDNTPGKKLTDAKPEQWAPIIEAFNAATLVTPDA